MRACWSAAFLVLTSVAFAQDGHSFLEKPIDPTVELAHAEAHGAHGAPKSGQAPARGFDNGYLRCQWTVDPAVRAISGIVTSWFTTTEALDEVRLDLSHELLVDEVTYHGAQLPWSLSPADELIITLPNTLAPGTLDSLTVRYHGVPPNDGLGSFDIGVHGPDSAAVLWTLSEPYGAKDWWPCKQDLNDKYDSLDVYVSTPAPNLVAGNGLLVDQQADGGNTVFHWKHRYPIAYYLIALATTNYQLFEDQAFLPNDTVPMLTFAYPENGYQGWLNGHADVCGQQMPLYSQLFGTYPFAEEKYGQAQFGWGGGMEHQTMTFVGGFSYELSAHELAHHWFGDRVTCGSWHDIWLNEGFATYLQGLCYAYLVPDYWQGYLRGKVASITSQPGGSVWCEDTTDIGRVFDARLTYNKGAMVLHMLRWVCGDSAWYQGVRAYLNDPELAYRSARTSDLQQHLEDASGLDLDGFMADWFHGEGYPTYTLPWTQDGDGTVHLTLFQSPSHPSVNFFELPVPVRFTNGVSDTTVVLDNTTNGQSFTFTLPFLADSALLDPETWLITGQNIVTRVPDLQGTDQALAVFPNPATTTLLVRDPRPGAQGDLVVYDGVGRVVLRSTLAPQHDRTLDIARLSPGVYTLVLGEGAFVRRARFVKQ